VFERTWGIRPDLFWPKATESVRREHPNFLFMAEVYWDLEWTMQHQGFDYAYDKRLYDRLREGTPAGARAFLAGWIQSKLARFLENHGRAAAAATFAPEFTRRRPSLRSCLRACVFSSRSVQGGRNGSRPICAGVPSNP